MFILLSFNLTLPYDVISILGTVACSNSMVLSKIQDIIKIYAPDETSAFPVC